MYCYEDPKLLKLFATIVRILYDNDILGEDTIKHWYRKGAAPKVLPFHFIMTSCSATPSQAECEKARMRPGVPTLQIFSAL